MSNRNPRPGAAAGTSLSGSGGLDWQPYAACKGADPDLFFEPDHYEDPPARRRREAKAKAVCAGCPVRRPCLEFGLGVQFGLWGGMSGDDRRRLKRRRQLRRRAQREEDAA